MNPKVIFSLGKKSLPTIMSIVAVGGVFLTGYFTHKAATKHLDQVAERMLFKEDTDKPIQEIEKDVFKENWKDYIPAVAAAFGTVACIVGANHIHLGREAAMTGAIAFYKALNDTANETMKHNSFTEIKNPDTGNMELKNGYPVYKAKNAEEGFIHSNPVNTQKIRIWEPYTKQWFEASQQEILWAELTANKMLSQRGSVTLNDVLKLYSDPKLKMKKIGDKLGWSWDDDTFNELSCYYYSGGWIDMCPQFEGHNGEMRFVMDYGINPNDISEL